MYGALRKVDRSLFVPSEAVSLSYFDEPIEIDHGQVTTQPLLVARMVCALRLKSDDRVLEVGTGLGYQAALLSFLCHEVYTIESRVWFNRQELDWRVVGYFAVGAMPMALVGGYFFAQAPALILILCAKADLLV